MAAAITKPKKTRKTTSFSFQSASATASTPSTTSVQTNALRAVSAIGVVFPRARSGRKLRGARLRRRPKRPYRLLPVWPSKALASAQDWPAVRRSLDRARLAGRAGLLRRASPRRRPRAPAGAGDRACGVGRDPDRPAVPTPASRRGAGDPRRCDRASRRLALGADAPGRHDGEGLRGRRNAPPPGLDSEAPLGREPRARAEPARPPARVRDHRGGAARDRPRAGAPGRLPPRRAPPPPMSPPPPGRGPTKRY